MTDTATTNQTTVLDALTAAIKRAGDYNRDAEIAPIAILWPDGGNHWRQVVPQLRDQLPILTLGDYDPDTLTGPAIWIRAELARREPTDTPPIVYLPGISKDVLRRVEEAPNTIEPLVYLQYRGAVFLQPNGKDWTLPAFFQNAQYGLGLSVDKGEATRTALVSSARQLVSRSLDDLRNHPGGIDADFLHTMLIADPPRLILDWINDAPHTRDTLDDTTWEAFCTLLAGKYAVDPERDGPSEAARRLGEAKVGSRWDVVWDRFAESPTTYPTIPAMLRGAKPGETGQQNLFHGETDVHWPQDNEQQENALRQALADLGEMPEHDARAAIIELESVHAARRHCVWARMGEAPLAFALQSLAIVANETKDPFPAGRVATMQQAYTASGWQIDAAALDAITAVTAKSDRTAIDAALNAIYTPWLWTTAERFQEAMQDATTHDHPKPLTVPPGSCVLFADGLRYDLAARLTDLLVQRGAKAEMFGAVGPLPGVTPSAKPAQSPVADLLVAGSHLNTNVADTGTRLSQSSFKKLLAGKDWAFVSADGTGKPDGITTAWTEFGSIDSYGHNQPDDLPHQAAREIDRLQQRITALLEAGWKRVIVVTDHGWLLTPRPMPKTELPQHLTAERKGRCARLVPGSTTHVQTVPWHWDQDVQIAMAPGISCFEDGKRYEHGGLSLQECIVPTITVSSAASARSATSISIATVEWRGLRCHIEIAGDTTGRSVDIRQKAGDAATSLATKPQAFDENGKARILIGDSDFEDTSAIIVICDSSGTPIAQQATIIGGE